MADNQQLLAINHRSGPALILAGPGSGKTYVLTHHISFLINSLGVSPANILVITFTKEAAKNMKLRFLSLGNKNADDIVFGTFHSVFYRFVRYFYGNKYKIIGAADTKKYIESIVNKKSDADEIQSLIAKYKSDYPMQKPELFNASYDNFAEVYSEYSSLLRDRDELDYDDILIKCHEILRDNPEFCKKLTDRFQYILIDEFQDISRIQYEIIKCLSTRDSHIYVVGDEDQSIYSFRGATRDMMKNFLRDYDTAKLITLETNYRSCFEIIDASNRLISNNPGRIKRSRQKTITGDSESFKLRILDKSEDPIGILKKDIDTFILKGLSCAVLLRTNNDVQKYKRLLSSKTVNSNEELKRRIISIFRDYLEYDLYDNPNSFFSILNIPERYLEASLFSSFPIDFKQLINSTKNMNRRRALTLMESQFEMLKKCTPGAFCIYIWNVCGLKKHIYDLYRDNNGEADIIFNDLLKVAGVAKTKEEFLEKIKNIKAENCREDENMPEIMTYHASKGLEFDAVFLPDVVEGHVPGRGGVLQAGIEEERRLFYVAMTRAKRYLYVYSMDDRINHSVMPSRFIRELMEGKEKDPWDKPKGQINNYSSSPNSSVSKYSSNLSNTASNTSSSSM